MLAARTSALTGGLATLVAIVFATATANAQYELSVLGWNSESGGADPDTVAARIAAFDGVDLWGLCEVQEDWEATFVAAAGVGEDAAFAGILGTTGGADRLLVIYDPARLTLLDHEELNEINPGNRVRSPLVARFRFEAADQEFLFVVNHLYRTRDDARLEQSRLLREWAGTADVPIIAVGDYNYDWRVDGGETDHDAGYDELVAGGTFVWVRPQILIPTQYSTSYAPAVLDFVFLAGGRGGTAGIGEAAGTGGATVTTAAGAVVTGTSAIVFVSGDFPDTADTPDHRPIRADFVFGAGPAVVVAPATREALLLRIDQLAAALAELRAIVEALPQ
jgi:hypothetical protein